MVIPMVLAQTRIQDGILEYSAGHYLEGQPLVIGFDPYGYNYQAHQFKGSYANAYLGRDGFPPYEGDDDAYAQRLTDEAFTTNPYGMWYWPARDVKLAMMWSDVWLSNVDRNEDGKLDRGIGPNYDSSAAPGTWLTNHQSGEYEMDGETIKWNYFVKIVYPGDDAVKVGTTWYTADEIEIGPALWEAYAIIQQIENDPGQDLH